VLLTPGYAEKTDTWTNRGTCTYTYTRRTAHCQSANFRKRGTSPQMQHWPTRSEPSLPDPRGLPYADAHGRTCPSHATALQDSSRLISCLTTCIAYGSSCTRSFPLSFSRSRSSPYPPISHSLPSPLTSHSSITALSHVSLFITYLVYSLSCTRSFPLS
jgi:hypothetical protein